MAILKKLHKKIDYTLIIKVNNKKKDGEINSNNNSIIYV